ncbi:MAG: hypothetical protein ABEJ71_04745 [Halodesulfurarchaeum sp.]
MPRVTELAAWAVVLGAGVGFLGFLLGTNVCASGGTCPAGFWDYVRGVGLLLGLLGVVTLVGALAYDFVRSPR